MTERLDSSGNVLKAYRYDSFGNVLNPAVVGNPAIWVDQSPFGYCGEYLDKETGEIYLRARYYDPASGRFNAEDPERLQTKQVAKGVEAIDHLALNQYGYCGEDPVNHIDPSGMSWLKKAWNSTKNWVKENKSTVIKIAIGVAVIAVVAVLTVVTGGAAAGIAGFIAASALKGAIIGAVSGAVIGAAVGAVGSRVETGNWENAGKTAVESAADGFMMGAVIGAVTGAIGGKVKITQAASAWDISAKAKTPLENMVKHYTRHAIEEGRTDVAKNIVKYTNDALELWKTGERVVDKPLSIEICIKHVGHGWYSPEGLIRSFFYLHK